MVSTRLVTLFACQALYMGVYTAAFQITAYFPGSPTGIAIGPRAVGAVFSAYPLATMLATPLPPMVISLLGERTTAAIGIFCAAVGVLAFGILPSLLPAGNTLLFFLLMMRMLGGFGASLLETACLTSIAMSGWGDDIGKALATIEVITGSASAFGGVVAGQLYEIGAYLPLGAFFTPCAFCGALLLLLLPVVTVLPPKRVAGLDEDGEESADVDLWKLLSPRRVATGLSLALSAAVVEAVNPMLEPHLLRWPYGFTPSSVGLLFGTICGSYMLCALATGVAVDYLSRDSASMGSRLKLFMAVGWVLLVVAMVLIGPTAKTAEFSTDIESETPAKITWGAAVVLGIASSALVLPSLPDMLAGVHPDDEVSKAAISSCWNGLYAIGSTIAPLASTYIYTAVGFAYTCTTFAIVGALAAVALTLTAVFGNNRAKASRSSSHPNYHAAMCDKGTRTEPLLRVCDSGSKARRAV